MISALDRGTQTHTERKDRTDDGATAADGVIHPGGNEGGAEGGQVGKE